MESVSLLSHQSHHVPGTATSIECVTESAWKGEVTGTGTQNNASEKQGQSADGPLYHLQTHFMKSNKQQKVSLVGIKLKKCLEKNLSFTQLPTVTLCPQKM